MPRFSLGSFLAARGGMITPPPSPAEAFSVPHAPVTGPSERPRAELSGPAPGSRRALAGVGLAVVTTVAALDVGLYGTQAGAGWAVAIVVMMGCVLALRPRALKQRAVQVTALLGVATAAQTLVDPGLANTVVAVSLLVVLSGLCFLPAAPLHDAALDVLAGLRHPVYAWRRLARWGRALLRPIRRRRFTNEQTVRVVVPIMTTFLLLGLLTAGNAVMARQLGAVMDGVMDALGHLGGVWWWHIPFWLGAWVVAFALLRPRRRMVLVDTRPARWLRLEPVDQTRAVAMLVGANAVFAWANGVDAVHLWWRQQVPAGVAYSTFVHDGVNSLTLAVLVAAVMLGGVFRHGNAGRTARWLGLVFVVQNLLLVSSVALRDVLYMQAYGLTEKRIHVVVFLALVATGFVLLAVGVLRGKTLGWLLKRNAAAAFVTLFAVQFMDTAGMVASFHVSHERAGYAYTGYIDVLEDLGVRGLVARKQVYGSMNAQQRQRLSNDLSWESLQLQRDGWRGWSFRRQVP